MDFNFPEINSKDDNTLPNVSSASDTYKEYDDPDDLNTDYDSDCSNDEVESDNSGVDDDCDKEEKIMVEDVSILENPTNKDNTNVAPPLSEEITNNHSGNNSSHLKTLNTKSLVTSAASVAVVETNDVVTNQPVPPYQTQQQQQPVKITINNTNTAVTRV